MAEKLKNDLTVQLLETLGRILESARKSEGDTLEHAAKVITRSDKADKKADKNSKANIHNIEKGKIFLPWKRLVAFAEYTKRDAASILVTLAAARAFNEIDDAMERDRLYSSLKAFLNLQPTDQLAALPREMDASVEHYRTFIEYPPAIAFWRGFKQGFLSDLDLTHTIVPTVGLYRECSLLSRQFSPIQAPKVFLLGTASDGIELALIEYLDEYKQLLPVFVDAESVGSGNLEDHINQSVFRRIPSLKHLSLSSPELKKSFTFIIYNLPAEPEGLTRFAGLVEELIVKYPASSFFVLEVSKQVSKLHVSFDGFGFTSFKSVPLSETNSLKVLKRHLRQVGLKSFGTFLEEDWVYLLVRHPLWLGVICRLIKERRRILERWEVVRTCAAFLFNRLYEDRLTREGLYRELRDSKHKRSDIRLSFLKQLAAAANVSIAKPQPENLLDLHLDLTSSREYRLEGPLLQRSKKGSLSFTSSWIRCYFAALHGLIELGSAKDRKKAIQKQLDVAEAIYSKSDKQRAPVVEFCLALMSEAYTHELEIYKALSEEFKKRAEAGPGLARNVMRAQEIDDRPLDDPHQSFTRDRPLIEVTDGASPRYLRVMIEDQAPGRTLLSLANTDVLRFPSGEGKNDALFVRPMLQGYEIVREKIKDAIDYHNKKRETEPDADIIVCPHFSLAWELAANRCAVSVTSEQVPALANLGFLANHYCKYQGQWIGIPFQFPTKFLCYRNDIIKSPPSSLAELDETIKEFREINVAPEVKAAIGLQGLKHPALYYEWLAFATATGGGDLLWDGSLQIGEVILDSEKTIEATVKFLKLFEHAHDQSLMWNWDGIIEAMASGKIAMCLPFSDTIGEINRRRKEISGKDDLSYAPFSLSEANSSPFVSQKLYGYGGLPLHVFTGHIMVAINKHPEMIPRETRFMQWFLSQDIQAKFSQATFQPSLLRTSAHEDDDQSAELFSSRVAQEYAFLPSQTTFENDLAVQISSHQNDVLATISLLVKEEARHPNSEVVRTELESTAKRIRERLRSKRS